MRDFANGIEVRRAISPAAAFADNTVITSQIVDLLGFQKAVFAIALGALAAGANFAVTVEHGEDPALADATAVPAVILTGTLASASFDSTAANKVRKIGYVGSKRYVRLKITPAGNAAPSFISATAILGMPRFAPTAAQS